MKQILRPLALAAAAAVAAFGTAVQAEQTIGIQNNPTNAASATARVTVRVVVPKVIILRVGEANANQATVTFTAAVNPAVGGVPGDSLAYSSGIAPGFNTSVATTNPATAAGVLDVGAWTNDGGGATLACALAADPGSTAFVAGATTAVAPGTSSITMAGTGGGTDLAPPGATLTACGASTSTINALTVYGGTFTFGTNLSSAQLAALPAGTYGNLVTFTATAP